MPSTPSGLGELPSLVRRCDDLDVIPGRGDFPAVADLIAAIGRFIDAWNDRCQPFTWTKDPDTVIARPPTHDAARHRRRQIRSTRGRRPIPPRRR
jgi:hypothetical protein